MDNRSEATPLLQNDAAFVADAADNDSDSTLYVQGKRLWPQYLASVIATVGGLIAGTCLAWTSPVQTAVENGIFGYSVDEDGFGWMGSVMALGAIAGAIITATSVDVTGRKGLMFIITLPCFAGWTLMVFSSSVLVMCLGRFLTGIATGSYCIVCPMYTTEISQKEIRGRLGTFLQLQITIGILFTYCVGALVNAKQLTVICALFPILYLFLLLIVPETPYFYMLSRNYSKAQDSLTWFRGSTFDGRQELASIQRTIEDDEANKIPFIRAFQTVPAKRGLLIGLGVMFLQQFSGCNAIIFYSASIFNAAGTKMDANTSTIIIGAIQVVSTWVATIVVDKAGRRILLLLSIVIMTLCTFTLGLYFYLKENLMEDVSDISWLPLLTLSSFIILFSLGFGPIPWMLMSEIFPSKIRSAASSLACLFNWLCVFIITKLFPIMKTGLGTSYTIWCFTLCSSFGILFVLFLIPETKNKSLQEVQQMLEGRSRSQSIHPHSYE